MIYMYLHKYSSILQGLDLLLGAPGLWYFTGGFIDLHLSDALFLEHNNPPSEINEMAGEVL